MKTIPLTKGYFTKVDDDDYNKFASIRWQANVQKGGIRAVKGVWDNKIKNNHRIQLSREIMKAPKGIYVDHINGDSLDNRKKNLRLCTPIDNQRNSKKPITNTSGYKGVSYIKNPYAKNKWAARYSYKNKSHHIGTFYTKEEAAKAYDKKAKELFGEFARLNFT